MPDGSGDVTEELRALAALRRDMVPGRDDLSQQAAFAARRRVSPAALEVALGLVPPDDAALGAFVTRMAARLPGTLRGGPVEDARWWCVVDNLVRKGVPAWAPEALAALKTCGVPAAEVGAQQVQALVEKVRQQSPLAAGAAFGELDKEITKVGVSLMDVEDQLDEAIGKAGVDFEKAEWYEAGMPDAPYPGLPARAAWKVADGLVLDASSVLDDLGRVVCSAAVLAEVRSAPQSGEAALRRAATSLAEKMGKTMAATLDAVLAIDGPVETPLGYRLQQLIAEPGMVVWSVVLAAGAAAAAWILWGRR